ncbi:MAG: hypothetical protein KDD94_09000, partial [Calditrichaeota bacterium]|nr:hypothetical protein [Calditrichota bacterium]
MAEAIKFEQKRNTGSILEATFSFYKQEFKTLAGSLLIIMLPAILISAILLKDISPATTLIDDFGAVLLGYLIALAIAFLNYIITYEYILLYLDHREITASILLQSSLSHIAKYFWIYLMTVIVLVISMFFFFIPA